MMEITSLQELQAPDAMTLAFGPLGLGGRMRPEDAAKFQQSQIADCDLASAVADDTRAAFERLRRVYAYGVLSYDIYTVVRDDAYLTRERALRDRFLQWCAGSVTFEEVSGADQPMTEMVASYEDVFAAVKRAQRRSGRQQKWKLRVGQQLIDFNGTLRGLHTWARAAGLLRGQRARLTEAVQTNLRNHVAHGTYGVDTPVEAASSIRDLAEFINQLWGCPTPGGRRYPAPVTRTTVTLGWNRASRVMIAGVDALREWDDDQAHATTFVLVRAVSPFGVRNPDQYLSEFDSRFETTQYPAEYLWGPGRRSEALAWLEENKPGDDVVDHLDRILLVRERDGTVYPPMRPDVAAGLGDGDQQGRWHAVRADFPIDAFTHARGATVEPAEHEQLGAACPSGCAVEVLATGSYQQAIAAAEQHGPLDPVRPSAISVPSPMHWPVRF